MQVTTFGKADISTANKCVIFCGGMFDMPEKQEVLFHFAGALRTAPHKVSGLYSSRPSGDWRSLNLIFANKFSRFVPCAENKPH